MSREDFIVEDVIDYSYKVQDCLKITFYSKNKFNNQYSNIEHWLNKKHYTYDISNDQYFISIFLPIRLLTAKEIADSLISVSILINNIDNIAQVLFEKTKIAYSNYWKD